MNITELQETLTNMKQALESKDYYHVDVSCYVDPAGDWAPFRISINYRVTEGAESMGQRFVLRPDFADIDEHDGYSIDDVVANARRWAYAQPSLEEAQLADFTKAVGRLMDKARDVGIDIDVVNPLKAMMEKLATNAITHHK